MENIGLKRGDLELYSYSENYPQIYEDEKRELEIIFKGQYITIEHVGSTAIKGIKSKPIIDIMVTVEDIEKFKKFAREHVQNEIYSLKEDSRPDDFLIRKEENGNVKAFIHVVKNNSIPHLNYILFRDYMNANEKEAKEYERLKEELLEKFKDNRPMYTSGKEAYINGIIQRALANMAK